MSRKLYGVLPYTHNEQEVRHGRERPGNTPEVLNTCDHRAVQLLCHLV